MIKLIREFKQNFSLWALGAFWLVDLFNPVFKKYDYGAEYPLILAFSVVLFLLAMVEYKKAREYVSVEKLFLLIFGLLVILSFNFSQAKNIGFSEVLAFMTMIVFYLIFANQEISWKESFLKIVKVATILSVIMGFILYFSLEENRMFGPFFNILHAGNVWPNAFALFLLMTWPLFILFKEKISQKTLLIKSLLLAFIVGALLLTFSRGAALVFAGQIVLVAVYFFRRVSRKQIILSLGVLALSFGIFFLSNYVRGFNHKVINVEQRVTFGNNEALTSEKERLDFWKGATELALQKPLLGWGPFSFRFAYNSIQKDLLANADHPHNIFLKFAVENGIPAMLAFLAFLCTILFLAIKRFKHLDAHSKDLLFILGICVVGGIVHDLIDYNFNFLATLLLLFIYLAFMRSIVVKKTEPSKNHIILLLSFFIAVVAMYEGGLLVLNHFVPTSKALTRSFYPRNSYVDTANGEIQKKNFESAMDNLDTELILDPLDSQAWHIKATIDCNKDYKFSDVDHCEKDILEAIRLNPMNDFIYYVDYFKLLPPQKDKTKILAMTEKVVPLLNKYFFYVQDNVHYTSYTLNVESAAELIDLIQKAGTLTDAQIKEMEKQKEIMMATAKKLRAEKSF